MDIRIIAVPPGEAPERIRCAWVGLVLPLAPGENGPRDVTGFGILGGPRGLLGQLWRALTGRFTRGMHYVVPVDAAVDVLARAAPDVAAWWRENVPHLFGAGRAFMFAAGVCEEVPGPGGAVLAQRRSDVEVRIVAIPPGEEPEHARRAWVGLTLPLVPGETGPREVAAQGVLGQVRRLLEGRRLEYAVPARVALEILERERPAAAGWWRENAPGLFRSGQTIAFPTEVCEKRVRLRVGPRQVVVGTGPVAGEVFAEKAVRRVGDDLLVIKPSGVNPFALFLFFFGTVTACGGVVTALRGEGDWPVGICLAAIPLTLGVWLVVAPWRFEFEFNRAAGRMRASRASLRRDRPLSDVLAVQLLVARGRRRSWYQLNLVLGDVYWTREQLARYPNRDAARAAAAELAGFLGIPLLDEVP